MQMWLAKDVDWHALSQPLALSLRPVISDVNLTFKRARLSRPKGERRTCIKTEWMRYAIQHKNSWPTIFNLRLLFMASSHMSASSMVVFFFLPLVIANLRAAALKGLQVCWRCDIDVESGKLEPLQFVCTDAQLCNKASANFNMRSAVEKMKSTTATMCNVGYRRLPGFAVRYKV